MGRPKKTGKNRMTTTSVHIEVGVLDRIEELGAQQSTYIREAVHEKLARDEGFQAAIDIQGALVDSLLKQTEEENTKLHELHEKNKEWKRQQEVSRVKDAVMNEYFTGFHKSKESLLKAFTASDFKTDADLEAIVNKVWEEMSIDI